MKPDYAAARAMTVSGPITLNVTTSTLPKGWEYGSCPDYWLRCPYCHAIGSTDDYDIVGLPDDGSMFCLGCGRCVIPVEIRKIAEPMPLFDGVKG